MAQYLKIAKVALRGQKQSLDASADRRDGARDEDGGTAGRAQEDGGDSRREEGIAKKTK